VKKGRISRSRIHAAFVSGAHSSTWTVDPSTMTSQAGLVDVETLQKSDDTSSILSGSLSQSHIIQKTSVAGREWMQVAADTVFPVLMARRHFHTRTTDGYVHRVVMMWSTVRCRHLVVRPQNSCTRFGQTFRRTTVLASWERLWKASMMTDDHTHTLF